MAIQIPNLFTRLGKIAGSFRAINGFVGTGPPSPSAAWGSAPSGMSGANIRCLQDILNNVQGQLQTPYPELLAGQAYGVNAPLYNLQTSVPSAIAGATQYLQSLFQGTIMDAVNADVPIPGITINAAAQELIRQMVSQSATVHANSVGSSVTAGGGNTGNPTIVVSLVDAHGKNLEYAYNEAMTFTTTRDASDGATAGNETITIVAPKGSVQPSNDFHWPSGNGFASGYSGTLAIVDPLQSNGSGGNLLSNSSFKTAWVSNQPPQWIADVGTAGTNWQDGTSNNYLTGAHCFEFLGDGSTLSSVYQSFANGGGTGGNTTTLLPATAYLFRAMVKLSAASPATGVLAFSLTDTSGNVLTDDTGNACTVSVALTGVGNTNYNALSGAFRTPTVMPTGVRLRMKLTTALPSGKNVFIDGIGFTQPTAQAYGGLYSGGPYIAVFRGSVDSIDYVTNPTIGDRWTVNITNDYGGVWQTTLWQLLNLPSLGIPIPSSQNAPTLADTLVS